MPLYQPVCGAGGPRTKKKEENGDSAWIYRALNKLPSYYSLPRIDGILDKLGPARFFTTLDAQSGYWQIPMHPDDVHKTAFLTHRGLFEFLRMPFGLTTVPGTYQMVMDDLLKEELRGTTPTVTQYLDDTLLFTVTFEEHLVVLEAILTKVESIDLKLSPGKCLFGADETEHLGHLIAHNLLLPAPKKVRAIRDWIEPINADTTATSSAILQKPSSRCTA
jgi:hypothetical protein